MDAILFLGREFLHKMTGSDVDPEERESYRDSLAAFSESEDGRPAPGLLIRSFNRLRDEEYAAFPQETMLWFLDWIASQENEELAASLDRAVFRRIWTAFDDEPVRLRVIEVALQWEAVRISPRESILLAIYEIAGDDRDLVLDALRFDGSEYARAVMRVIGL
jgi:hypothetical protein